jgi:diguanylate cyclase (GGDEF)-like protein
MHLLIVEDDALSRSILDRAVRSHGHTTESATDGDAAWLLLTAYPDRFDGVLSGWVMPGLSGPELCARVRSMSRYISFVLVTGRTSRRDHLDGMRAGADDYLDKPINLTQLEIRLAAIARINDLHATLRRQAAELERQASELQKLNQLFWAQGRLDRLTGIANRLQLEEDLALVHQRSMDLGIGYSLAIADVDHFKWYNDGFGHPEGDAALRDVAHALSSNTRQSDKVYRYGGEEFCVVIGTADPTAAWRAVDRLRSAVERIGRPHVARYPRGVVTISAGVVTVLPTAGSTWQHALSHADTALYLAKANGRNRVESATPAITRGVPEDVLEVAHVDG